MTKDEAKTKVEAAIQWLEDEGHAIAAEIRSAWDHLVGHISESPNETSTSDDAAKPAAETQTDPVAEAPVEKAPEPVASTTQPAPAPEPAPAPSAGAEDDQARANAAYMGSGSAPAGSQDSHTPAGGTAPVDETLLELGNNPVAGTHPRVDLQVGEVKTKVCGPFPAGTKVKVGTIEFSGGSHVGLEVMKADGTIVGADSTLVEVGEADGQFKDEASVSWVAEANVSYPVRIMNRSDVPTSVHVQLFPG